MAVDTFIFNGSLERGSDLAFMQFVSERQATEAVNLLLVTAGGDPNAAFKISRYLQTRYTRFTVTVSGLCKSAGTLLALGAHDLVFAPYGELGPLDVQMSRSDHVAGLESGLNISEAFQALEQRARSTFQAVVLDILTASGGVVSFPTAAHSAIEAVSALYSPIFERIDPEEVGSRSRAMRIGQDYGQRLNAISQNLKDGALRTLSETYSSHGFVIDLLEAKSLFANVREATVQEMAAIMGLGQIARQPIEKPVFDKIEWPAPSSNDEPAENENAQPQPVTGGKAPDPGGDGSHSQGAV